jgi:fatty-acyl-CoA synthase
VQYLRNGPEYLESFAAALKGSMVPVNTNYRYGPGELSYLWRDCDARAVVFAGSFAATIERTRASVPGILAWLWVDDGAGPCPAWAAPYESAAAPAAPRPEPRWERDGDDIILLSPGAPPGCPRA